MKKFVAFLVGFSLLGVAPIYAKGPQGGLGKAGPKPHQGAGIGKEVSKEAKALRGQKEKKEFGETVRERAHEKSRIEEHKELKKQKTTQKHTKKEATLENATSQ